jgi:hypothetical protein
MKLAVIIAPMLLLLFPLTTYAASAQGRRDFIINEPFEKVLDALSDPEELEEMLTKWNAEIVTFQWEELDAGIEKELFKGEKAHWEAKLKFKTHIRMRTPRLGVLNIHARVTVYRSGDSAMAHFQLLRPVKMVGDAWAKVELIRQGKNSTLLRARLYARAHPPYFRCCLIRRIANRIAQREVCSRVGNLLWTFERKVRIIVAEYKEDSNEKMDLNSAAPLRRLRIRDRDTSLP